MTALLNLCLFGRGINSDVYSKTETLIKKTKSTYLFSTPQSTEIWVDFMDNVDNANVPNVNNSNSANIFKKCGLVAIQFE